MEFFKPAEENKKRKPVQGNCHPGLPSEKTGLFHNGYAADKTIFQQTGYLTYRQN
jgi:hypothetical protein